MPFTNVDYTADSSLNTLSRLRMEWNGIEAAGIFAIVK
jgi:hypothetical protein